MATTTMETKDRYIGDERRSRAYQEEMFYYPPIKKRRGRPSLYLNVWRTPIRVTGIKAASDGTGAADGSDAEHKIGSPTKALSIASSLPPVPQTQETSATPRNTTSPSTPPQLSPRSPGRRHSRRPSSGAGHAANKRRQMSSEDLALRKFYEAGGRDYKQFLQWKSQKGEKASQEEVLSPPPQLSPAAGDPKSPKVPLPQPKAPSPMTLPAATPPTPTTVPQISPYPGIHPLFTFHPWAWNMASLMPATNPLLNPFLASSSPSYLNALTTPAAPEGASLTKHSRGAEDPVLDLSVRKEAIPTSTLPNTLDQLSPRSIDVKLSAASRVTETSSQLRPPTALSGTATTSSKVRSTTGPPGRPPNDMSTWDAEQVVQFVCSVPGCAEYAEVLREQGIDGAALQHLSEEHLLKVVKMKLGPAIRLRLAIQSMFDTADGKPLAASGNPHVTVTTQN